MPAPPRSLTEPNALFVDQYQLTMVQAYLARGMHEVPATFSLFVRRLPRARNYLLAAGLEDALAFIERLRFDDAQLRFLKELGLSSQLTDYLASFRFTGDVHALPEGTPFFADEPLLEVEAPLAQAQLLETFLMNQVHLQTLLASKAARIKRAAGSRAVVDFGARRIHGVDAAVKAARAFHIAGIDGTSNVLAGQRYGIPVTGTMAHSYVQACEDELAAFRDFVRQFPDTILLVDTYDTLSGVRHVVELARELGSDFRVRGIRLDSGDLGELAKQSRRILDDAGLPHVQIFASGGLTELRIARLNNEGAPIDGFGVGTAMGVSSDEPQLDIAYKLTAFAQRGNIKLSEGKQTLPGRKQVYRVEEAGHPRRDTIAQADEVLDGTPLLTPVMRKGERTSAGRCDLAAARERARVALNGLPPALHNLDAAEPPYPVRRSEQLDDQLSKLKRRLQQTMSNSR